MMCRKHPIFLKSLIWMTFCECDNLRWTQDWDLHSHTVNSDGMYDEKTVAEMMKSAGVKYWSLTDHDTTAGWIKAAKHCSRVGINFIPGIEITCKPDIAPRRLQTKNGSSKRKTSLASSRIFSPSNVSLMEP